MSHEYGQSGWHGRNGRAHRIMYEILHGPIPADMVVMHTCDNTACVNPAHLRLGTSRDNQMDCKAKGRLRPCVGERHGRSKLSSEQARTIVAMVAAGNKQGQVAGRFGVSQQQISRIVRRQRWKHLSAVETPSEHTSR